LAVDGAQAIDGRSERDPRRDLRYRDRVIPRSQVLPEDNGRRLPG
jgi:hypothetical protein